jgi:hypothetical protein
MISQLRHAWRSLAGGELSEEMFGRVDLPRNATGLKRCYNAIVTPQGAIENRAGTRFISTTNDNNQAWLVPFVRSDGQGFLLEFGDATLRIVGGGNIINEETDPGDTITVTSATLWVTTDGLPTAPALFTTSGAHGLVAGDAIRFQDFSLVNPDQNGVNILAGFMNVTWYVATAPTTTTFTISSAQTPVVPYADIDGANLDFESGLTDWTFSGNGSHAANATAPVYSGAISLKLGVTDNPNGGGKIATCDTRFPITAGQPMTVAAHIRATPETSALRTRLNMHIVWYNAGLAEIETTSLPLDSTLVQGLERITADGMVSDAAENVWVEVRITTTAPAGAAFFSPRFTTLWGDSAWAVDAVTVPDARATWSAFSGSPYNGLINTGTVALAGDTSEVSLTPTYTWSHIRFAQFAQFVDDLVIAHKLYPTARLTRVNDNDWTFTAVSFNNALAPPGGITATAMGTPGAAPITYSYAVTTTDDTNAESAVGTLDDCDNTLRTLGNFNEITWTTVTGVFRFNVYKDIGGSLWGFIGASTGTSFADDNITPDYAKQPPEPIATFASAGAYPGTVCFHEQRMILAGTEAEPQAFWASGLAAFDYFKASVPPQDDQAFTYELAALKSAPILHSLALHELLLFTSGGVQRVVPVETALFGPVSIAARPVVSYGAHELAKPQEAGTRILYPVERGGHLYQLTPEDSLAGYGSEDLSIIAAHLIDKKDWVQTGFRRAPFPIWFGLRDDGILVGLTYMPEQEVFAWHHHEFPGAFIESFAVVPEGKEDSVYVVARRTINDLTVRYIERIESRTFTDQPEAFFIDSGFTYRGAETSIVTGLDHLEGQDVMALADGRVLGPYTVFGGEIEVDALASVIHVGLSYTTQIETIPLAYTQQPGYGVGIMKNVSQVWLRLKQSLGLTAGVSFDAQDQRDLLDDVEEELGSVPALRDGIHGIDVTPVWNEDTTICLQQTQPLPFTLTGLAIDYVDG